MRWLLIFAVLILGGCIRTPEPEWLEIPTANQLLAHLESIADSYSTLDGVANVALTRAGKFVSSQQFMLLQKPDHLRTDALTGFGQLILQLTSDGEELSVFLNTTVPGRFFRGVASAENISRFIRIPLAVTDLLSLLLYSPPLIATETKDVAIVAGLLRLTLHAGDRSQQVFLNQQLQVVSCKYLQGTEPYLTVVYERFSAVTAFPQTIIIELPQEETRIKVKFSELQLNTLIAQDKFRLRKPDNLKLEYLP